MGFVKTDQEISRIEAELSATRWSGEWLSVRFLTDPGTLERLLPPGLEPASEPVATVTVGRWESNCLGDFSGGALYLPARHGEIDGGYVLALYIDSEPPIAFGREVFGEPKKFARSGLFRSADGVHAWVDRHGTRLIDLRADLDSDEGPARIHRSTFNYKARTATGGRGLEEDAILTRTQFAVELRTRRSGRGRIELGETVHDPLSEIEVLEVGRATYGRDESSARCEPLATVPADEFLPYHYGRQDDWLALDTQPT